MDKYQITFRTWNKLASLYQEKFMDLDLYDDTYDLFCEQVNLPNAKVLEMGCGPGNITKYLVHKRPDFKITAIDVAANMIELAKKNNPSVTFQQMDARAIDEISDKFEGIMIGFCMPYLSQTDCSKLIKDSYDRLKKGGVLYFSFLEGDYNQSGFMTGTPGDQVFMYYHEEDFFKTALQDYDFEWVKIIKKSYPKPNAASQIHLIFITKKI